MATLIEAYGSFGVEVARSQTQTISGTVENISGVALRRTVVIFPQNNPYAPLGMVESHPSTGAFSFTVPGTPNSEYAVVALGIAGENWAVHSHKTPD